MTRADVLLGLYGGATALLTPLAEPLLRRRLGRGKEDPARMAERTGRAGLPRPEGALVWVHGASVGEGLALVPLIEALTVRDAAVLVTTGTVSSARVLAERLPAGAFHQFVPLDLRPFVRRFVDHWRPDLVLLAESELWPNLLAEVARRGTPLAQVNARMSARSFARWRNVPWLSGAMMNRVTLSLAQTVADADRLTALGAGKVLVTGNVKFDAPPPPADPAALADLASRVASRPSWLAASIHADEEGVVVDGHRRIARAHPNLLTIVVPRRSERGPMLAERATACGLQVQLRSDGQSIESGTEVYVADTMGEMGLFYRLAQVVFVGKSLSGGGGQNPIEPAKLRRAVLHGRQVENFTEVYRALDEDGGALAVSDGDALADAVSSLLSDADLRAAMAARAAASVGRLAGATERTMAALAPLLPVRADVHA